MSVKYLGKREREKEMSGAGCSSCCSRPDERENIRET